MPHLVKIDGSRFMILWTEADTLKYALVDNKSGLLSDIYSSSASLSDCKPIFTGGKVVWYVTQSDAPDFYAIDPDAPETVEHTDTTVIIDPCKDGHQYSILTNQIAKVPTASNTDKLILICRRCDERTPVELPTLNETAYTIDETSPTCIEKGSPRYFWNDTRYGNYVFSTTLPMTDHTRDTGTVTKEPTATETGVRTYTCTVCSGTKEETIPKISHTHSFGMWYIDTESVLGGAAGSKHRVCKCGKME